MEWMTNNFSVTVSEIPESVLRRLITCLRSLPIGIPFCCGNPSKCDVDRCTVPEMYCTTGWSVGVGVIHLGG